MGICKAVFGTVAACVLLAGCAPAAEEAAAVPELLEPVNFVPDSAVVEYRDIVVTRRVDGAVVPEVRELYFPVDGVMSDGDFYTGKEYKAGETIAALNEEELREEAAGVREETAHLTQKRGYEKEIARLAVEEAETELVILEDTRGTLEADLDLKRLEIEELRLKERQAQERYEVEMAYAESRLAVLEKAVEDSTLRAPFNGRIQKLGGRSVTVGVKVKAYETIVTVANDESQYIETKYISDITLRSADRMYAKIGGKDYPVTAAETDRASYMAALAAKETPKSRFRIDAPEGEVQLGDYVTLVMETSRREDVLALPVNAVHTDMEGSFVYLLTEGGQQERRSVKTGLSNGVYMEIQSGLEEGDRVYVKD